jgi:hypothetical protein
MHFNGPKSEEDDEDFEGYLNAVIQNGGHLSFPPFFVKCFDPFKQIVLCESFKLTTKFPDNIVCFSSGDNKDNNILTFCCLTAFFQDSQLKLQFRGRAFKEVKNTFDSPFPSSLIGNYISKLGVEDVDLVSDFSNIIGKCFPFPLKMSSCAPIDPLNKKQHWIFQIIKHSDIY